MQGSWVSRWGGSMMVAALAVAASPSFAAEGKIYTGGKGGSYFNSFGPLLSEYLKKNFFNFEVVSTAGSGENIDLISQNPVGVGLVQTDVLAFRAVKDPTVSQRITIIRSDIADECLFAVTQASASDRLGTWGDVQSYGRRLRIVTGPQESGSAATFAYLQTLNEKLGQGTITNKESVDAAIDAVIQGGADVAFFVQFPDPNNPRFEKINTAKLAFIPVIDRAMLRERVNDQKVYLPQEVKVTSAKLLAMRGVQRVTTACTPIAYITGNPAAVPEGNPRRDLEDLIETARKADVAVLRPKENWFASIKDSVVEASGGGLEALLKKAEDAAKQIRQ